MTPPAGRSIGRVTRISTATLVYDGDCGFCSTAVRWLEHHLPAMPATEPSQWADLHALGLSAQEAQERVWLVVNGRRHGGHHAVSVLLRRQPHAGWRLLGWLLAFPPFSPFAAAGYALVARYRHRLPGGTPTCRMR